MNVGEIEMAPIAKDEASKGEAKKRRVTSAGPTAAAKTPKLPSKAKMYHDITKFEEDQASSRSAEDDSKLFASTCDEIRKSMKSILDLKLKKGSKAGDIVEARTNASLHFLTLKKLNRLDKFRTRSAREETTGAKQRVDSLNLQLQNLLYELAHLQKEITKCQQFKSKHEDIDLIAVEDFYREAPESIARDDKTQADEHLQQLSRLEFEHIQRKDMNSTLKKLEETKEALEKQIGIKRDKLTSLKPQLANILEVTKPVQEYLEMPLTMEKDQLALHRFLPRPLFVLYAQASSFGKACDSLLKVRIKGDLEEAKTFNPKRIMEYDAGGHDDADEEELAGKAKRSSKGSSSDSKPNKIEERFQALLQTHPLEVDMEVLLPEEAKGTSIHLNFKYLYILEIITVKTKINLDKDILRVLGDKELVLPDSLLCHLSGIVDTGLKSPNPATQHLLKTLGITQLSAAKLSEIGMPFVWAQLLGGLDFPAMENSEGSDHSIDVEHFEANQSVSQTRVGKIVGQIRERLQSRLELQTQISLLQKAKMIEVELDIPEEVKSWYPNKASSKICNWTSVNWDQYKILDVTQHLVQGQAVDENDFFYRLQINRDPSAKLIALIAVKPDYPNRNPVFCLNLHWEGEYNVHNCEHIRDLELLINRGHEDLSSEARGKLLSLQLQRLLTSLDALLEAWSILKTDSKASFPKEKLFLQPVREHRDPIHHDVEILEVCAPDFTPKHELCLGGIHDEPIAR
eukprot:maker-scaffold319_size207808-snap-gene-0.28 protein:Tk00367 transcript:maker-scaffold319_size207808-snap-gene-0.28-mRNA-1 annotation:"tho complex subunit 5-like protein"